MDKTVFHLYEVVSRLPLILVSNVKFRFSSAPYTANHSIYPKKKQQQQQQQQKTHNNTKKIQSRDNWNIKRKE
ncbi:hypothetical protein CVS40_10801 [Lucilia cuprina]|nr:hypothetical protein CVS40_10801 [Lucilia cuprina]